MHIRMQTNGRIAPMVEHRLEAPAVQVRILFRPQYGRPLHPVRFKQKKMNNNYHSKVINMNTVFDECLFESRALFQYHFDQLPGRHWIGGLDSERAFTLFKERFSALIVQVYEYKWYKSEKKKYQFCRTNIVLKDNCMVEFGAEYCDILHDGTKQSLVDEITALVNQCRKRQRREPLEINLIVRGNDSLDLKPMEIKRTKLDLDLFYENDFKETDATIRKRLSQKNDKGIVLLHGLPGAGKTTYLRHLIGVIKKRILFLSPSVAGSIMNPDFIQLLIDNPNSVMIIEDAENIIMDRKLNPDSTVSALLNISDGLMADFLNVQIICTFNSPLTLIDSALLRKGRLIAKHEFGKLGVEKAQRLSRHFGFDTVIRKPMTIAELANQHEKEIRNDRVEVIGFRRHEIETVS